MGICRHPRQEAAASEQGAGFLPALVDLFAIRLQELRESWYWYIIGWFVFPLGILVFLHAATAGERAEAVYVITGNAVVALVLNSVQSLANELAWSRQRSDLDYYSTLPISRLQLVLAYVGQAALVSVPGAALNLAVGAFVFALPLHPRLGWLAAAIVLMVLSLAGVGVAIGVTARTGSQASVVTNLILVLTMFLSPVMVPAAQLPKFLQEVAVALPTTYAADALRAAVGVTPASAARMIRDLGVLAAWAAGTLYLALTRLEWRTD